jgi:hypothetical protein
MRSPACCWEPAGGSVGAADLPNKGGGPGALLASQQQSTWSVLLDVAAIVFQNYSMYS